MMRFFEYTDTGHYPILVEIAHPYSPLSFLDPHVFLVCAEDQEKARKAADRHIYEGVPLSPLFGTYQGQTYHGEIKCAM